MILFMGQIINKRLHIERDAFVYKVLIIDDHLDQRELISFLLKKHTTRWEILEATNGKQGIDLFSKTPVDAIITDVKMPFINGIELAEAIRKKETHVPIIFISGFDDFNYVKNALTLNAVNYLLKPINPVEFSEQLDKITELIEKNHQLSKQEAFFEKVVEKEALTKLIQGIPMNHLLDSEKEAIQPLNHQIGYLLCVDIQKQDHETKVNYLSLFENLTPYPIISPIPNRYLLFLEKTSAIEAFYQKEKIHQLLTNNHFLSVHIHISQDFKDLEHLFQVYTDLNQSITKHFYHTQLAENKAIPLPTNDSLDEVAYFQKISEFIQKSHYQLLFNYLEKTFRDFQEAAYEAPSIVKFFFATLYKHLIDTANIEQPNWHQEMTVLLEANHYEELRPVFLPLFDKMAQREALIKEESNDYIREIKEYVFNHYHEELSLDRIAEEINITPKYLSELFIKEEGMGLSKFIKEIRLNQAKELLKSTNKRVTEISRETGFNNHSYFIKTFREKFEMTPDNYRKSLKR